VIRRLLPYLDFLAFVPLAVLLAVVRNHDAQFPERWAYAYFYAFWPALAFGAIGFAYFPRSEKLWLGNNVWLAILGALTHAQAWPQLRVLASAFQESGGFVITAVIGLAACILAPGSFVGAPRSSSRGARYAWLLTVVAAGVATLSFFNQGTRSLSVAVPVVLFVGTRIALTRHLRTSGEA